MIVRTHAYPRGALIGNPSDGYFGKTIALTFRNFRAEAVLYESPDLELVPSTRDHSVFSGGIGALAEDVRLYGYYGGIRLLKATAKRFHDHCRAEGIPLHDRNFTLRYSSNIPHLVGLAGSSAIITACFRALMRFYEVSIPKPVLANLVLSAEKDELGIAAGLQDRVAQVYQGAVYMDFDRAHMEAFKHGRYEPLDARKLPPLYIAYRTDLAEVSDIAHKSLRQRFEQKDPVLLDAIRFWAELTVEFRAAMEAGDRRRMAELMNANFDRRAQTYRISEGNMRMIQAARSVGASAKFTGSGGAIIGTYEDEAMFGRLERALGSIGVKVLRPEIAPPVEEEAS
jgi:glucuronokinase